MAIILQKEVEFFYFSSRGVLSPKVPTFVEVVGRITLCFRIPKHLKIEGLNNLFYPADKQTGILFRGNLA